jgi:hypothetical protein
MLDRFSSRALSAPAGRPGRAYLPAVLALLAAIWPLSAALQSPSGIIGRLHGDDVMVQGAVSFESEGGRSTALLGTGSDITVREGMARIELAAGGEVAICGPAHLTVLESGGAITLALEYGQVRPQVDSSVPVTVFTPLIVATPVAIGTGDRDVTVGIDQQGAMCALTSRGAVRIEQQLTGQSVLLPQGGEVNLTGGQLETLRSSTGSCHCQLLATRTSAPRQLEVSVPVRPTAPPPRTIPPPPVVPRTDEPIYRVYVPPLTFDATAPEPPPDPSVIDMLMVREAEPLPEVLFRGNVQPSREAAIDYVAPSRPQQAAAAEAAPSKPKRRNIFVRFFSLFRGAKSPCAGAGCGSDSD